MKKIKKITKPFEGDTYLVAQAINRNAEVLEDALRRIWELEKDKRKNKVQLTPDSMGDAISDKIRAEFKRQGKWLFQAGYTAYNADLAFRTLEFNILKMVEESNGRSK